MPLATIGRNAMIDALSDLLDGGTLQLATSSAFSTIISTHTLSNPFSGSGSTGVVTASSIGSATAGHVGNANVNAFRLRNSSSSTVIDLANEVQTFANTDINTTTDAIAISGNTFSVGERVIFSTTGTLSTNLTALTAYYVVTAGTNIQVSATAGGSPINFTDQGTGTYTINQIDAVSPTGLGGLVVLGQSSLTIAGGQTVNISSLTLTMPAAIATYL